MNSWVTWTLWVPSVLFFIVLPGSVSLSGPSFVKGIIGGSLSVRCTYQKKDTGKDKFWCQNLCLTWNSVIVKTSGTKREVTRHHVTIRDDPENLTFTVTMEHLRITDAGMYTCGISDFFWEFDSKVQVVVFTFPALLAAPQANSASPETSTEPALFTWPRITQKESPGLYPSAVPEPSKGRSLLDCIHLWILVFLKVPVLLGLLGAILWVRWPQIAPRSFYTPV